MPPRSAHTYAPTRERSVLLAGPPAAGKSTAGALLAARLGLPFVDLDEALARRHGAPTCAALFARLGEPAFRALEGAAVREALAGPRAVVALGGGALVDAALRYEALAGAWVLGLRAEPATLAARAARDGVERRPLLASATDGGALEARLAGLLSARAEGYAEAHGHLATEGGDGAAVAAALASRVTELEREPVVPVPLGARTYPVRFGPLAGLRDDVAALAATQRVLVLDGNALGAPGARAAVEALRALGPCVEHALRGAGDREKTLATVDALWSAALGARIDRACVWVGLGGGVTTDLTGFAAATVLRGVRFVAAPTTLLAMADASVGGKTGFDHPLGKNLVGAVHQPSAVRCAVETLETLPPRELRAGLAEVAKIALACDEGLLAHLEARAPALRALSLDALAEVLPAAVWAKARVVALDEHERSLRAHLNLGHTLGHALERALAYRVPHGEAVAVGLRGALALGVTLGVTPAPVAARAVALLDALGLPAALDPADAPEGAARDALLADARDALRGDKKNLGGALRFVLLEGAGRAGLYPVAAERAHEALARLL